MAQRDSNSELAGAISKLSNLMRYMLYESKSGQVSLISELGNLKNFIGLARMRYSEDEAKITIVEKGNLAAAPISPMLLLPFVENAFKHGVMVDCNSWINVTLEADRDRIIFVCENGKLLTRSSTVASGGIGLENVKRRLELLYPGRHRLSINDAPEKYEVVLELNTNEK